MNPQRTPRNPRGTPGNPRGRPDNPRGTPGNPRGAPGLLGRILLQTGAIDRGALTRALREQRQTGERLGTTLVRMKACGEEEVAEALARQINLPYVPPPLKVGKDALTRVGESLARSKTVLPLLVEDRVLRLAMADPLDLATADDVQFRTGLRVDPVVASPSAISEALDRALGGGLRVFVAALPGEEARAGRDHARGEARAPAVQLVDRVLGEAVAVGASDVHLERYGGELRVRLRVDGVLGHAVKLPRWSREAVLSRVKILAGMDISVKQRPQDGGFTYDRDGRHFRVRVSTIPVDHGEKAVLRILDPGRAPADLEGVGLAEEDLAAVRGMLARRQGVILAAGPTGSGKSTTLFGALGELDRKRQNVVTLEDPIEYRLDGVNQVQVRPKTGLTFPVALRAVLRQDPDVVMVGEIRDRETAEIAMAAAVTGHLVLSSIHTIDAPGAIARLLNMGVPAYLVAGGLSGVIAQRLVRRACPACRGTGRACDRCEGGFRGRIGIFQVLVMSDRLRDEAGAGASTSALRELAVAAGMGSMAGDARRKLAEGLTTPHEVGRVIGGRSAARLACEGCGEELPPTCLGCPWCGAPRVPTCACGRELKSAWRFCPDCLRPATPADGASAPPAP